MREIPKPGEVYLHYSGNHFVIICIALNMLTSERLVIYAPHEGDELDSNGLPKDKLAMSLTEFLDHAPCQTEWKFDKV